MIEIVYLTFKHLNKLSDLHIQKPFWTNVLIKIDPLKTPNPYLPDNLWQN